MIIPLVAIGYFLKKTKAVKQGLADDLMTLIFYIFLPATLFYSLIQLELKPELLLLPLSASIIALSCYLLAYILSRKKDKKIAGPSIIASGAMNQVLFTYPFFLIYTGTKGLGYVAFFDLGQAVLGFSLGYYIALKYGKNNFHGRNVLKNMFSFPPLPTLIIALMINYFGYFPKVAWTLPYLQIFHDTTTPLVMIFLGIFLEPKIKELKSMIVVLITRFGFSLLVAYLLVTLFGLAGLEAKTVLIASIAPPAMLTLIYSSKEGLDTEYSAAVISAGIIFGLLYMPLMFTIL